MVERRLARTARPPDWVDLWGLTLYKRPKTPYSIRVLPGHNPDKRAFGLDPFHDAELPLWDKGN
jgi:hypothetical protein